MADHFISTGSFSGGRESTATTGYATVQDWQDGHADAIKNKTPSGDYLGSAYISNGSLVIVETVRITDPLESDLDFIERHNGAIDAAFDTDPPEFP